MNVNNSRSIEYSNSNVSPLVIHVNILNMKNLDSNRYWFQLRDKEGETERDRHMKAVNHADK